MSETKETEITKVTLVTKEIQCSAEDLITNKRCIKLTINYMCEEHKEFMEMDWKIEKEKIEI